MSILRFLHICINQVYHDYTLFPALPASEILIQTSITLIIIFEQLVIIWPGCSNRAPKLTYVVPVLFKRGSEPLLHQSIIHTHISSRGQNMQGCPGSNEGLFVKSPRLTINTPLMAARKAHGSPPAVRGPTESFQDVQLSIKLALFRNGSGVFQPVSIFDIDTLWNSTSRMDQKARWTFL